MSRGRFLRDAAGVASAAVVISGLPQLAAAAAPSAVMDKEILNYFLMLEYLQEEFYDGAVAAGALQGELKTYAETARENEREHVSYLRKILGSDARAAPTFDFGKATKNTRDFRAAAVVIEETSVSAYIGQGANLTRANVLSAARIVSVDARHAAWVRDIGDDLPAPAPADSALSEAQVKKTLKRKGWVR
jgi:Ferritin-like domain